MIKLILVVLTICIINPPLVLGTETIYATQAAGHSKVYWNLASTNCNGVEKGPLTSTCTATLNGVGVMAGYVDTVTFSRNVPLNSTHRFELIPNGDWYLYQYLLSCPEPIPDTSEAFYSTFTQCQKTSYDWLVCRLGTVDIEMIQCCSNGKKDGLEFAIDQGGECENINGNTCPSGQVLFTANGGNWCGLPNNKTEAECDGPGPSLGFPSFWSITGSQCLEITTDMPIYQPPGENTDLIAGVNDTNKILSDLINATNSNAAGIIRAINTNTDMVNQGAGKIVAAIVDSKSAIVAAINSKDFSPTINVAAPSVSVSAPSVTVDTSAINAAITAAATQAGQDSSVLGGKIDALTAAIMGQAPGAAADLSGVESRLDALNAKMTGPSGGAVAPVGDFDGTGDKVGRFETRFAAFRNTLKNSPLIDSVSGVFDFPSGGGGLSSSSISMGSYGSYTMDLSPVQSGLNMFGILVVGAACLVGGRVILIKG